MCFAFRVAFNYVLEHVPGDQANHNYKELSALSLFYNYFLCNRFVDSGVSDVPTVQVRSVPELLFVHSEVFRSRNSDFTNNPIQNALII